MFLENWSSIVSTYVKNSSGTAVALPITVKLPDGISTVSTVNISTSYGIYRSRILNFSGMHIGTGKTTPKASDYKLENQLTTYSNASFQQAITVDEGKLVSILTFSGTYIGTENIEITEVGGLVNYYQNASASFTALATRDLLETPIQLIPNQNFQIEYKIAIGG